MESGGRHGNYMEHIATPEICLTTAGSGERLSLLYTVAFDPAGAGGTRQMVKMLAGSVARTYFTGDMVMVRNSTQPVFLVQRAGIEEYFIETPRLEHQELADYAMAFKAGARHHLPAAENYEWVVFLDADCLCLRNIDHLLRGREGADILFQPEPGRSRGASVFNGYLTEEEMGGKDESRRLKDERSQGERTSNIQHPTFNIEPTAGNRASQSQTPGQHGAPGTGHRAPSLVPPREWGVNSGTWAVRGKVYHEVMEEWERIQNSEPLRPTKWREQSAWNRLILDAAEHGWRAEAFEAHEIQFPLHLDRDWKIYKDAAIVHCIGGTNLEKIEFMFGLYMQRFFYDPACTLLSVVEM